MVHELLKKAEILTERDEAGRAVTFNNLACYYRKCVRRHARPARASHARTNARRRGKLHAALTYLQKALRIEARLEHVDNPADTHLNMCAVLSQLGRHSQALEHAQSALILLQEELFAKPLDGAAGATGDDTADAAPRPDRFAVLAIAYHNIAVEQVCRAPHPALPPRCAMGALTRGDCCNRRRRRRLRSS